MWQYTSSGQMEGIQSDVDMNLCFVPFPLPAQPDPAPEGEPSQSPLDPEPTQLPFPETAPPLYPA